MLPDCSVAGTQTILEWVRQQRYENYPGGYERFLKLCLSIICQVAQVGPSARWHGCPICNVASTGSQAQECLKCTAVLHMLQSRQGEQALYTGSSTRMGVLQCSEGEQAGSICRAALPPLLQCGCCRLRHALPQQ